MNEADTYRTYVLPKLKSAGWEDEYITEQLPLTPGRIVPIGDRYTRKEDLRPDYVLFIRQNIPILIIEAKAEYAHPGKGLQQAIQYAEMLNVKFAYSSNGKGIVEHDFITGMERNRPRIKPRIREWMMVYSFIREKFVDGLWARLASLRELQSPEGDAPQSAAGEELSHGDASQAALMPSILDKAFKGEL